MKAEKIERILEIPDGVKAELNGSVVTVTGPKGEAKADFWAGSVRVSADSKKITLSSGRNTKKERQVIGTFSALFSNVIRGVTEGHKYRMKICSGHFPMTVKVDGREFSVNNFVGEKTPRKLTLPENVSVKVKGNEIELEGPDRQIVGSVAGSIENLTRRTNFDRRIFQDGILLITEKNE